MRFWLSIAAVSGLAAATAGCSSLPSQGPSAMDIVQQGTPADPEVAPRFLITDLNEYSVSVLEHTPLPSLYGRFGDHRAPPSPVIGVGDALSVTVWEAAAGGLFSAPALGGVTTGSHSSIIPAQVVARDGSITVPYAGRIRVVGLTPPQVEAAIVERLSGKAIEPQALVSLSGNISNTVTVTGEVTAGARVPLTTRGDRILDVIASVGGVRAPVHAVFLALTRGNMTVKVPMEALLKEPRENIYLRPGDILTAVLDPQTFTAFGSTPRNALVSFDAVGITLEEAVAKAGGLLDLSADPQGVFVLRVEPVAVARQLNPDYPIAPGQQLVNVVYRINLKDANTYFLARRFPVRNKDVIYVAASPSTELQKALTLFNSVASPAYTAAAGATLLK
ncbi:MAG: polysaccharide biosynthesis/export protein [Methylobacteriaceae bacterium]|nr:polysaccharide biosynthesis/export protein [Methylobacteriaceae bacterium]